MEVNFVPSAILEENLLEAAKHFPIDSDPKHTSKLVLKRIKLEALSFWNVVNIFK